MKKIIVFALALPLFSCGSALHEPISYETGCENLEGALREKCPDLKEFKCENLISCGSEAKNVEKADVEECMTNIKNSKDCAAAFKLYCAIACEK